MIRQLYICTLIQLISFASFSQTLDFDNSDMKIGDSLIYSELYTVHCQMDENNIPFIDSLANFLIKNKQVVVSIEFHSDIRDDSEQNKNRTKICGKDRLMDYYIETFPNLNKNRIHYFCFGESNPLISQKNIDAIKDPKEKENALAQNSRTVIKIIQTDF